MDEEAYPALYRSSDAASTQFQKRYLRLIKAEYALLLAASVLSLSSFANPNVYAAAALVLAVSVAILLTRAIGKPEQDWYKARALSESIKTLTWRYAMKAHPFDDKSTGIGAKLEFKENLERIFKSNQEIAGKIAEDWSAGEQITSTMDSIRDLPLADRQKYYQQHRISNQREWYARKAKWNRQMSRRWVTASVIAYVIAMGLSIARVQYHEWPFWPIEPLIVVASSIVGWVQIKKFNELAAAYSVTAHEIGLINITLTGSEDVKTFSDFVGEAELAFSREHTLWIARQAN